MFLTFSQFFEFDNPDLDSIFPLTFRPEFLSPGTTALFADYHETKSENLLIKLHHNQQTEELITLLYEVGRNIETRGPKTAKERSN